MVSIIVPVYKTEKYLDRCVSSILNQTYQDLELILVDDGSLDNCPQMCDAFAEADPRVRVIHKVNGGVCSARNAGLDAATGDYITFVDSDDWIERDMYAAMMEKVLKFDCDVVLCDCVKDYVDHNEVYTHPIRAGFYDRAVLEKEYFPHLLMMENVEYPATISNCLLLFRRELAENIRYLTGVRYSEDLLFGAQLMYKAQSFYYMKGQAYYHYVMNPTSATHRFVSDRWNDYLKLHQGIKHTFGTCESYDFSHQIDLCLLFFVYNAVGNIYGCSLGSAEKKDKIMSILKSPIVVEMLHRIRIWNLPISAKQKILTQLYRYRVGVPFLIHYFRTR